MTKAQVQTACCPVRDARVNAVLDRLRADAAMRISSDLIENRRTVAPHIVFELGNHGLLSMDVRRQNRGKLEFDYDEILRVQPQPGAIDLTLASVIGLNNAVGIPTFHTARSPTALHARPRRSPNARCPCYRKAGYGIEPARYIGVGATRLQWRRHVGYGDVARFGRLDRCHFRVRLGC